MQIKTLLPDSELEKVWDKKLYENMASKQNRVSLLIKSHVNC